MHVGGLHPVPQRLANAVGFKQHFYSIKKNYTVVLSPPFIRAYEGNFPMSCIEGMDPEIVENATELEASHHSPPDFYAIVSNAKVSARESDLSISIQTADIKRSADGDTTESSNNKEAVNLKTNLSSVLTDNGSSVRFRLYFRNKDLFRSWSETLTTAAEWSFDNSYALSDIVGTGHFAKVYKATQKSTGDAYAVKIVTKAMQNPKIANFVDNEYKNMRMLDHPHLLKTHDVFESPDSLFVVLDFMYGGLLFDVIEREKSFSERDAADIVRQILMAVRYLHDQNIVHGDIKPDSILCINNRLPIKIKVADFGLSAFIYQDCGTSKLEHGSWFYTTPEVILNQKTGTPQDMWGVGIIMFMLISGKFPFEGTERGEIQAKIRRADFSFPAEDWKEISADAKDMIKGLLNKDQYKRLTVHQAIEHPWMLSSMKQTLSIASNNRRESIRQYSVANRTRKEEANRILSII